jgi:hypothetical protein
LYSNDISRDANADADGNDNGVVDAADYVIWGKNLGQPTGSGAIANGGIPEPATTVLSILGVALGGCMRRRVA